MTTNYGKVAFGKNGDEYFAYACNGAVHDYAASKRSQEVAFMKLCDILANKLNNIHAALNKDGSEYS